MNIERPPDDHRTGLFRPDLARDLGPQIPLQATGRRAHRRDAGRHLLARRPRRSRPREGRQAGSREVGAALPRRHSRPRLPACRPHPRRRRHGAQRYPLQLLRSRHHRGRPRRHLQRREGRRADDAAGRWHRPRLLDATAQGCARRLYRRRRLGAGELHGRVGRHVPHHHVRGQPPRRHDGDAALRSSRHRDIHRRQVRSQAPAQLQPVGAGDGRVSRRRARGPALGAQIRRQGLPHRPGARAVGASDAGDLRFRRAGRGLHRPRECAQQPALLRGNPRHQPVRRAAVAALRRLPARFDQSRAPHRSPLYGTCRPRSRRARGAREARRALPRQRHRRLQLPARAAAPGGDGQAPHRPRRDRTRRCADLLRHQVRHRARQLDSRRAG